MQANIAIDAILQELVKQLGLGEFGQEQLQQVGAPSQAQSISRGQSNSPYRSSHIHTDTDTDTDTTHTHTLALTGWSRMKASRRNTSSGSELRVMSQGRAKKVRYFWNMDTKKRKKCSLVSCSQNSTGAFTFPARNVPQMETLQLEAFQPPATVALQPQVHVHPCNTNTRNRDSNTSTRPYFAHFLRGQGAGEGTVHQHDFRMVCLTYTKKAAPKSGCVFRPRLSREKAQTLHKYRCLCFTFCTHVRTR